jgi:hypothetical protein
VACCCFDLHALGRDSARAGDPARRTAQGNSRLTFPILPRKALLMTMLKNPAAKYRAFGQINLPDRQWPSKLIEKAPRWLSTDLRDGNQSIIDPMDAVKKRRFFDLLVEVGLKEIEIGFPSAGAT